MDRAGRKVSPLTPQEIAAVFKVVWTGGSRKEAWERLPRRNRNTVYRAYEVTAELCRRNLEAINRDTAVKIADSAGYSYQSRRMRP